MTNKHNDTAEVGEASASQSDKGLERNWKQDLLRAGFVVTERDLELRQLLARMVTAPGVLHEEEIR